ncbi:uncharacterized protein LOC128884046 [Hylaeus volcanicus]|uniref:uncharacterized protein LOC128884046 n=1 Tax=Hylaeus volcanicus TaxID=313075 RepID=UPI0023B8313B|nr:uncharacterized protein LOC128884046 [Hylaeus volcanicus]
MNQDIPHILCTGGAGYIGSHTIVHFSENTQYRLTILDNLSNCSIKVLDRINLLCKKKITFLNVDLCNEEQIMKVFSNEKYDAVIHYAGLKAVNQSVEQPLQYYSNNLCGTINLLKAMEKFGCTTLVFSSSATVYKLSQNQLKEEDSLEPSNPYGKSKLFIEQMLKDIFLARPNWKISILRYFNPIGAHPSGMIGDSPEHTLNLLPYIQKVAIGHKPYLDVFGTNWNTPDGTGVRDYIHVIDLAEGHLAALRYLEKQDKGCCIVHNLGSGNGVSVKEMVQWFERVSDRKIPMRFVERRPGDLPSVVADSSKAFHDLKWKPTHTVEDACKSAWIWQSNNPNGYE